MILNVSIWFFSPLLFRWLNTLGMLANQGIDVVIRHSFFDHGYNHLVDQNFNPLPVSVRSRFPTPFPCPSVLLIVLWSPLGEFFSFCYSLISQIGQKYFWPILQTFSFTSQTYPNIYSHVCTYGFTHIHIYAFIYIYHYYFNKPCAVEIPNLLVACLNSAWEWIFPDCFLFNEMKLYF